MTFSPVTIWNKLPLRNKRILYFPSFNIKTFLQNFKVYMRTRLDAEKEAGHGDYKQVPVAAQPAHNKLMEQLVSIDQVIRFLIRLTMGELHSGLELRTSSFL